MKAYAGFGPIDWALYKYCQLYKLGKLDKTTSYDILFQILQDVFKRFKGVRTRTAVVLGELEDSRAIPALVKVLNDDDGWIRSRAAEALAKLGSNRYRWEHDLFAKKELHIHAAVALAKLGDSRAIPALVKVLNDDNSWIRLRAAEALVELGDMLEHRDNHEHFLAAEALGECTIPTLVNALNNDSMLVRSPAAVVLAKLGDSRAIPALINALGDADDDVRCRAVEALAKLGEQAVSALIDELNSLAYVLPISPISIDPLQECLNTALRLMPSVPILIDALDDFDDVRCRAVEALAKLREQAVSALIKNALNNDDIWLRALGKLGDRRAIPALVKVLNDDDRLRLRAAVALGELGDSRGIPTLINALNDDDRWTGLGAAEVLAKFAEVFAKLGEQGVSALINALNDDDRRIRLRAAEVLGELGDSQAIPALINALNDNYHGAARSLVRLVKALGERGDKCAIPMLIEVLGDANLDFYDPYESLRLETLVALLKLNQ